MKFKKVFFSMVIFSLCCVSLFAHGKKDIEEKPVEDMNSWTESFDLGSKTSGKYNIFVTAKDMGGNTYIEGPFNLYVDPKSDLCIPGITNPTPNMRIVGNLNIVGTCVDDDGVAYVELILDGDKSNPIRAEGAEFWSYYLDTTDLEEGPHTIQVTGTDINGLVGKTTSLTWQLDRRQPTTTMKDKNYKEDQAMGQLLSGKVDFYGLIEDGNGIKSLAYSLDNGEHFTDLKIKVNPKQANATFKLTLDTKKFDDGPAVVWFKATDNAGSVGAYAYLFFVDNTPPDVQIISPAPNEAVNGKISIAGCAKDAMGIKELTWKFGNESGEVELVPGNPYWCLNFDTVGSRDKSRKFSIRAIDIADNIVEVSQAISLNQDADKPSISILQPVPNSQYVDGDELYVRGVATDDDAIQSVKISIDGKEMQTVVSHGAFYASLGNAGAILPGKHKLSVVAVDINGVESSPAVVDFTTNGGAPEFDSPRIARGKDSTPFAPGAEVHPESGASFDIDVKSTTGLISVLTSYSWGANESVENKVDLKNASLHKISIPINNSFPRGVVRINATATDLYGRSTNYATVVYVTNTGKVQTSAFAAFEEDDPRSDVLEIEGLTARFALLNEATFKKGMTVELNAGESRNLIAQVNTAFTVTQVAYEISGPNVPGGDVTQTGTAKLTKPSGDDKWTVEIPLKNLPVRETTVRMTIRTKELGEQTVETKLNIIRTVDRAKVDDAEKFYPIPSANVVYDTATRQYVMQRKSDFYFYANYPGPISAELIGGDGLNAMVTGRLVTITPTADGTYERVRLRVVDILGDTHETEPISFMIDTSAPDLNLVTSDGYLWARDTLRITGTAADASGVKSVDYSFDGGNKWETISLRSSPGDSTGKGVTFRKDVSLASSEEGIIPIDIRAVDNAGNEIVKHIAVHKDVTPPEVEVLLPKGEDIVNGETLLVFKVKDNSYLSSVKYVAPSYTGLDDTNVELNPLVSAFVGTDACPIDDSMAFVFEDGAGNKTSIELWDFLIDSESDLPVVEVHVPEDNQVITRDFTISGIVYDDDGDCEIFYKIDDAPYQKYPIIGTSYSIDIPLLSMTDNEHVVSVYAVDVNGVKGEVVERPFRISLEEPKGAVVDPPIDIAVRELITISGVASDKNGIETVQVSLDNGNSYNDAVISKDYGDNVEWTYTVDTRVIPSETSVVFLKITDKYGIQGLYSSLINVDNWAPKLTLELPKDDSTTSGLLFFSGYVYDNIEVTDMRITIRNMDRGGEPYVEDFPKDPVIGYTFDMRSFRDGSYNIQITAEDRAGNRINASRNIYLEKNRPPAVVDILYPLNGEHKNGEFNIYGQVNSESEVSSLKLYVDKVMVAETVLTKSGFYKFEMSPDLIADGAHTYYVQSVLESGVVISSREQTITYSANGPWVTIDNFTYGDFATRRPYLRGRAGYTIDEDELLYSKTKEAPQYVKDEVAAKSVAKIELSFDNGKTFIPLSKADKWRYRIENQDIAEGYHFLLLRATMKNGEVAIERTIVQIDNTKPMITLIAPTQGGRYNQEMIFSGISSDDVALEDVKLTLRKGDKASYEIPAFIQGLYLDFNFWGASLFSLGAGLTFFDNNVKVQFHWGQFTQAQRDAVSSLFGRDLTTGRYGGNIIGGKLLANIGLIPFSYFFGHDWEWLYAAFALGADFAWFTETPTGRGQMLSAVLAQLEFPKVKFEGAKMFSEMSLYGEFSLWIIPTDVSSSVQTISPVVPQFSIGFRTNVF